LRTRISNSSRCWSAELRREAIELAIAGASKVIEKNLDDQANRKIVESFLSSIPVTETKRG
jgi:F-type H+-transporting ATPase subunit b